MYQPLHPHIPAPPTKKLKLMASLSLCAVAVLTIVITVLCFQLVTAYHRSDEHAKTIDQLTVALAKKNDELTIANRQLIVQTMLPDLASFPSQCPNGNQKDGLFLPLSQTPIEGYNVFMVDCRSYITTGKSLPRILIFHVNDNGGKDYTYGSNAAEPLCITNKLPNAHTLSEALALPVCQSN